MWKIEEKGEELDSPNHLPPLDTVTLVELRRRYKETPNVESRTRYQMILLAQQDYKVPQIARIVLRSEDTVARVLKRFLAGGLDAVPRHTASRPRAEDHGSLGNRVATRDRVGSS